MNGHDEDLEEMLRRIGSDIDGTREFLASLEPRIARLVQVHELLKRALEYLEPSEDVAWPEVIDIMHKEDSNA